MLGFAAFNWNELKEDLIMYTHIGKEGVTMQGPMV